MQQSECEELAQEAMEASKHSLQISANLFEEAAKCYDRLGDRKKAGQYLTLAGDFFLDLDNKEKAATCYGKAIMRHLMIDDIETAELLLEKGKEYGFSSNTYQYRIALDALERQAIAKLEEKEEVDETVEEVEVLPDIDIVPIDVDEEEELIPLDPESLTLEEDVKPIKREFLIPQLEEEEISSLGSFVVLAAVSKETREKTSQDIQTEAVVKRKSGESQIVEPEFTLKPMEAAVEKVTSEIEAISDKTPISEEIPIDTVDTESKADEEETAFIDSTDTLDLDYSATSEITNEFEEDLVDIEIVNTIPFSFEVVNVKTDFQLDDKRKTTHGLVFTWKKDRIEAGKKGSVEYILRKRVERSIILRKENKVSVINMFHSVKQDLEARIDFVNTTGTVFHEVLIEDVIPPELVVTECNVDPSRKIKPVSIPTHDSTFYRWIFSTLPPGDNFSVSYNFREKPLTRHYIDEIECDVGIVKIEKISQPVLDTTRPEYIWFYKIENPISEDLMLVDRIPSDFNIILIDPIHLIPSIKKEKTHQSLTWLFNAKENFLQIILRIRGSESFTPPPPSIVVTQKGNLQLVERSTSSEKKLVDIKRLKEST
ncbi:MAG: hypothetical protein JSV04_10025 [Candidatus Heimdallarchaeota archaeon]|nr:MAG: hypothetical protein JSV04_10025 [Candidatus Heimdallarchaeota archaeon]